MLMEIVHGGSALEGRSLSWEKERKKIKDTGKREERSERGERRKKKKKETVGIKKDMEILQTSLEEILQTGTAIT